MIHKIGKWVENMQYHYKVGIILGGVCVVLGTVILINLFTNIKPDVNVMLLSTGIGTDEEIAFFRDEIGNLVGDVNKDGKVYVEIKEFDLDPDGGNYTSMLAPMTVEIAQGHSVLYIFDKKLEGELTGERDALENLFNVYPEQKDNPLFNDYSYDFYRSDYAKEKFKNGMSQEYSMGLKVMTGTGWENDERRIKEFEMGKKLLDYFISK